MSQLPDHRENLIACRSSARIDQEDSIATDGSGDVPACSTNHVDIARDVQTLDLVVSRRIFRLSICEFSDMRGRIGVDCFVSIL